MADLIAIEASDLRRLCDDHQRVALRLAPLAAANSNCVASFLLPSSSLAATPALLPGCTVTTKSSGAARTSSCKATAVVAAVRTPRVALLSLNSCHPVNPTTISRLRQTLGET